MSLPQELTEQIYVYVWSGFYTEEEIHERIEEMVEEKWFDSEETDAAAVDEGVMRDAIAAEFQKKRVAQQTWPATTDCDRLDRAFERLNGESILAAHNAGYTQSDGLDCVRELYHERGGEQSSLTGFCFYHEQDLERALRGQGLMLAFGAVDGSDERDLEVGRRIQQVLTAEGFKVAWDGSMDQRITIRNLNWQRRSS